MGALLLVLALVACMSTLNGASTISDGRQDLAASLSSSGITLTNRVVPAVSSVAVERQRQRYRELLQEQHAQRELLEDNDDHYHDIVKDKEGEHCQPLTKELISQYAQENLVMMTFADVVVMKGQYVASWIDSVTEAKIGYWFVGALDDQASVILHRRGVKQCFDVPAKYLGYQKGRTKDYQYKWGDKYWTETCWARLYVIREVYAMGFHVIHSDTDVTWFSDPLPYFRRFFDGPPEALFSTDSVLSHNKKGDTGLEASADQHISLNAGVYFIRQWPKGLDFFDVWLTFHDVVNVGHDQDGMNFVARGKAVRSHAHMPEAIVDRSKPRMYYMAHHNTSLVGFLPSSMFANSYTFTTARLHQVLEHPLYEVHWVWGGKTLESKRQNVRDALKFSDKPRYYHSPNLISMDLTYMEIPPGYNDLMVDDTEKMILFHVKAADYQLQQLYRGFAIAMALNRTIMMPKLLCYCVKNWYMTQACRLNWERATVFPFVCPLSQLLRTAKLVRGLKMLMPYEGRPQHTMHIREHSFLLNSRTPQVIKSSRLVVVASGPARTPGQGQVPWANRTDLANGTSILETPWPLDDVELRQVLAPHAYARVLHFKNASQIFSGFRDGEFHKEFDRQIQQRATYWCCRSPHDSYHLNKTFQRQLVILPPEREAVVGAVLRDIGGIQDKWPLE